MFVIQDSIDDVKNLFHEVCNYSVSLQHSEKSRYDYDHTTFVHFLYFSKDFTPTKLKYSVIIMLFPFVQLLEYILSMADEVKTRLKV